MSTWLSPLLLFFLSVLVLSGCIPTRHFRALATSYEPIAPRCKLIERCDYRPGTEQARCEMASLAVPESGALAVCEEETWGD